jgi:phage terminase large subunit
MEKEHIAVTSNFWFINDNFNDYRGVVLPGGTRSGKTIAVLQWLIYYCIKPENKNKTVVICRDILVTLKKTTLKDFIGLCYGFGKYGALAPHMTLNKTDLIATIGSNQIIFIGLLDNPERTYGLESDIFYINEAVATRKFTFNQLNQRCNEGFILDCNPSYPNSWVYNLEMRDDVNFFRTTFLDNPFLNKEIVKEIKAYEPTEHNKKQGTADIRMWSIYGKGLIFKGKEIVYPDWNTFIDYPDSYDWKMYGLDWGWTHPLAVCEVVKRGNDIFVKEIVYQSELEFNDLITKLKTVPLLEQQKAYLICDSAEPRSINRLRGANLPASKANKKGGSVLSGIRVLQSLNIFIHEDSKNAIREINNYKFKVDKQTDTVLEVVVKENDDFWDSVRYVADYFA